MDTGHQPDLVCGTNQCTAEFLFASNDYQRTLNAMYDHWASRHPGIGSIELQGNLRKKTRA